MGADPERIVVLSFPVEDGPQPARAAVRVRCRGRAQAMRVCANWRAYARGALALALARRVAERAWSDEAACGGEPGALPRKNTRSPTTAVRRPAGLSATGKAGFISVAAVADGRKRDAETVADTGSAGPAQMPTCRASRGRPTPAREFIRVAMVAPRQRHAARADGESAELLYAMRTRRNMAFLSHRTTSDPRLMRRPSDDREERGKELIGLALDRLRGSWWR